MQRPRYDREPADHSLGEFARYFSRTFVEDPWAPLMTQLGVPNPGIGFEAQLSDGIAGSDSLEAAGSGSGSGGQGGENYTEGEIPLDPSDDDGDDV